MSGLNATLGANGWDVPAITGGIVQRNPDGSVSASVQPRSNTLASLLALAGLAGEDSYPTDTHNNAKVQHTAVAGKALPFYRMGQGFTSINNNQVAYEDGTTAVACAASTFTYDYFLHGDKLQWQTLSNLAGSGTTTIELNGLATECNRRNAKSMSIDFSFLLGSDVALTWNYSGNSTSLSMTDFASGGTAPRHYRITYYVEDDTFFITALNDQASWFATVVAAAAGTTDRLHCFARNVFLDAAGTLATHTVKLPAYAEWIQVHGNAPVYFKCDQIITVLTVSAQAGETLRYSPVLPAITAEAANGYFGFAPGYEAEWVRVL